jgi:hypothetical protein
MLWYNRTDTGGSGWEFFVLCTGASLFPGAAAPGEGSATARRQSGAEPGTGTGTRSGCGGGGCRASWTAGSGGARSRRSSRRSAAGSGPEKLGLNRKIVIPQRPRCVRGLRWRARAASRAAQASVFASVRPASLTTALPMHGEPVPGGSAEAAWGRKCPQHITSY